MAAWWRCLQLPLRHRAFPYAVFPPAPAGTSWLEQDLLCPELALLGPQDLGVSHQLQTASETMLVSPGVCGSGWFRKEFCLGWIKRVCWLWGAHPHSALKQGKV